MRHARACVQTPFLSLLALLLVVPGLALALDHHEMAEAEPAPTLYERLGGYDALAAVTDDFIGRLAGDEALEHFFAGHSTDSLNEIRQLIVDQLCQVTGGPCVYVGRDMKTAHGGLGITAEHWQTTVAHLVATLDKFEVPEGEKGEVLALVSTLEADIVD